MTTCVINPQRNKGEPLLPPVGILAVNPSDSSSFADLAKKYGLQKHFLFNSNLYSGNSLFVAGPAVGAPMAAICLEKIIAMGAKQIILYGWCGSLTPALRIGNLFMPISSVSEEGTSVHYQHSVARVDDSLHTAVYDGLTANAFSLKQGAIWTTDAVYRETKAKIANYASQGIMAVDMEYTALKAVSGFRQVIFAAVLLVSDELFHHEWAPKFVQKSFRSDSKRILDRLCALIEFGEVVST